MVALRSIVVSALLLLVAAAYLPAQGLGAISGRVRDKKSGEPLPYVNVVVKGTSLGASGDEQGHFLIAAVPAGTYTLVVSVIGHTATEMSGIVVKAGDTVRTTIELADASVQMGEVVVFGASMKGERLAHAPAAVTVLEAGQIQLTGGGGQVPRLLETQPGVDIAQSGLNDFNINTRGFNSSLNRRLLVLLDGRDLAIAFLGAQEWNGLAVPVEDLGRLELIRGPSSALYGANAFNGVISIATPRPKDIPGTKLTLAGGELSSLRADIRHAGLIGAGSNWSYKINAGRFQGDTWSVDRYNLNFEYPGFSILNNEEAHLSTNHVASTYASARIDHDYSNGAVSTVEAGIAQVENEIFVTGIGRVLVPKALKPFGRISYSGSDWYMQVWGAGRSSQQPQLSLSSGLPLDEHSFISQAEAQYRHGFFDEQMQMTSGLSFRYQTINTNGTLMQNARNDNSFGAYTQLEYRTSPAIKYVAAGRWDQSTLHESRFSPKLAVVWSPLANHTFRATFNQAFQAPNLSELYLYVLRTATNPFTGAKSYFAYHGNAGLKVEKITGWELGYNGVLFEKLYLTVDGYYNTLKDFITDLAPGVHPDYPEPSFLPGDDKLRAIWSYSNAGKVNEDGVEIGVNYYLTNALVLDANYALFDFTILEKSDRDILLPNAPRNKANAGITWRNSEKYEFNVAVKYVPGFDWAAGIYQGYIPEYTLVNASARYTVSPQLSLGVTVANLFDRVHYEIFGGSLLKRRALATATYTF